MNSIRGSWTAGGYCGNHISGALDSVQRSSPSAFAAPAWYDCRQCEGSGFDEGRPCRRCNERLNGEWKYGDVLASSEGGTLLIMFLRRVNDWTFEAFPLNTNSSAFALSGYYSDALWRTA
jgi:hypothetical protein